MHSSIFVFAHPDGYKFDEVEIYDLLHECIPCEYVREIPNGSEEYESNLGDLDNYYENSCRKGNLFVNSDENRDNFMEQKQERIESFMDKGLKYFKEHQRELKELVEDIKGFYVVFEENLYTLDSFIADRDNLGTYVINQIFDYHY